MSEDNDLNDRRSLVMSSIMTPNMVNFRGNVHGGYLLQLLDQVAFTCGSRYSGHLVVTLSVDGVFFKEPIHVGELVTFYARINHTGKTSMEVGVRIIAENLFTHQQRHTNTSYITVVAVDEQGKPTRVPQLAIDNEVQQRRFDEAVIRREARMQLFKARNKL